MMLNQFFFQSLTSVSSVEGFWCKVSFRFKCSISPQTLANSTHPTLFLTCDNVSIRFEFVTRSCCVFCVLNLSYFNAWAGILLILKEIMCSICERQYDWGGYSQVSPTPPENWPNKISRTFFNIRYYGTNKVMASITKHDKAQDAQADEKVFRLEDFPVHEKLEKFMEDVKWVASEVYDFLLSQSLWFCDWYLFSGMASTLWLHSPWQCHHPQKLNPQLLSSIGIQWNYLRLTDHHLVRICRSDSEKANEPEPQDEESRRVNTMQVCFSNSNQKSG